MTESRSITTCFLAAPSNTPGITVLDSSDDEAIVVGFVDIDMREDVMIDGVGAICAPTRRKDCNKNHKLKL